MKKNKYTLLILTFSLLFLSVSCSKLIYIGKSSSIRLPKSYNTNTDSTNIANIKWKEYFKDKNLQALIDTALKNNQELNIVLQEIEVLKNEIRAKKGEYLPFVGLNAGVGMDKNPRYTNIGAMEENAEITPGNKIPEPLSDFMLRANFSWEVDIWRKLRNAKKSATLRYLASIEGKNFMLTNIIAEISKTYYELMALDNKLKVLQQNIAIQEDALEFVRLQKSFARSTELSVAKFEAEVYKNKSKQYVIKQQIIEAENRLNFLVGSFPKNISRNSNDYNNLVIDSIFYGVPSQLLLNRTDVKQAEYELEAAKIDIKVARANFYPSLRIDGTLGYRAFNPAYLVKMPESILFSLLGDAVSPLINRNAIKATYNSANAKQIQALYNYEKTLLKAYIEVVNNISNSQNLMKSYDFQSKQVEKMIQSVSISKDLFASADADYLEVLMTQRDAIEAQFELIDTKKEQLINTVNTYQVLGGGWK